MNAAILACSQCFGEPTAEITIGAKAGVLFLLGVIGCVLAAIVAVTIFWSQRAKMLEASDEFDRKPPMRLFEA